MQAANEATELGEFRMRHWVLRPLAPRASHIYVWDLSNILLLGGSNRIVGHLFKLDPCESEGSGLSAPEGKLLLELVELFLKDFVAAAESIVYVHSYDAMQLCSSSSQDLNCTAS